MEINGLPLHALVVHAAVVLGPPAAPTGLLYATVPRWRDWLRWPLAVLEAVALASIWVAYLSGEQVAEANTYGGPLEPLLEEHEERAEVLRLSMTAFAIASFAAAWWHARTGVLRTVLSLLVGATAILTLAYVVLTGDAGAQIAWFGTHG
ncbi:hypothetical protein NPS01_27860 [Nocardioides psychrotolerans]|uniref:DUF2231 domain-containing protein n=1 Tax=Nocardioides psychrotolerans TaxID=1005945 RepID=A0A1I3EV22_9ACTN|nr:DUF2231 domain-containing protein [Nocardioides psychrotolerans]GEP39123.1 hypothetical protein NPS01_27860 [Nocardioides psychrotolerans]SFI02865.1 hypothetical protein SAMN05216561_10486 [Nocardioides psychrotolerans]